MFSRSWFGSVSESASPRASQKKDGIRILAAKYVRAQISLSSLDATYVLYMPCILRQMQIIFT